MEAKTLNFCYLKIAYCYVRIYDYLSQLANNKKNDTALRKIRKSQKRKNMSCIRTLTSP